MDLFQKEFLEIKANEEKLIKFCGKVEAESDNTALRICRNCLESGIEFSKPDFLIRSLYADILIVNAEFSQAANVLANCKFEELTVSDKVEAMIKISECFLEDDNYVSATEWIQKTNSYSLNPIQLLRIRTTEARIWDQNRQFLKAARRYYNLSQDINEEVDESSYETLFDKAVICCLISDHSPQKERLMTTILKDGRSKNPSKSYRNVLSKIEKNKLVMESDLLLLENELEAHQNTKFEDLSTPLSRAILAANLKTLGKQYSSIELKKLASLLDLPLSRVCWFCAEMISSKRLKNAIIDEAKGVIRFTDLNVVCLEDERIESTLNHLMNFTANL
eukprot:TRINITY_DN1754_c0_g1_i2.p1 TRINITY_DN1754_c0_g1~~TRINITY_DN1754_c0_g1_i2.p1  ORF type:complete len:335 (-),score=63.33 TRINITY_DN1754_c0_g1_i2:84-1088(-)